MSEKSEKQPPKGAKVKNKAPAEIQITAEQLLREASERRDTFFKPLRPRARDGEEANELKQMKRKNFEDAIRRNRSSIGTWLKYAAYEEEIREFPRARSVYERVLEIDSRNIVIWLKYAEMEMKNRNLDLARNVWNRAITILPFVEQFWYKYAYFEEMLGNVAGARQIFERWMAWEPKEPIWMSYVKLEKRYKEYNRVREIFENFIQVYPSTKNYIKYAKFEEEIHAYENARKIYERVPEELSEEELDGKYYLAFAKFELRKSEIERVRGIYKYACQTLPKEKKEAVEKAYLLFEKQYGVKDEMEFMILMKRREYYENEIKTYPKNYDNWFDYIRLEEAHGERDTVRALYQRAVAEVPLIKEKKYWKRYIYLWIYYAVFEELDAEDVERAGNVYKRCLEIIPHSKFTFTKIWSLYSKYLIRKGEISTARKNLGLCIGKYPKEKSFKDYIEIESSLREFDRVRVLYQKYLCSFPENSRVWIQYAEFEKLLGDEDRARGIYELAIGQETLTMPELLWKSFIDFELDMKEHERARELYERLLERSEHVKVWCSYGQFEASVDHENDQNVQRARVVFERAYRSLRDQRLTEERIKLLEAWLEVEKTHAIMRLEEEEPEKSENVQSVLKRFPKKVTQRNKETDEEEEVWLFPEDVPAKPLSKLLEMAYKWKTEEKDPKDIERKRRLEREQEEIDNNIASDSDEENNQEHGDAEDQY